MSASLLPKLRKQVVEPVFGTIPYAPGADPLCGAGPWTDEPATVAGCDDCLDLVAEDLADNNDYQGRCLHCRKPTLAPKVELVHRRSPTSSEGGQSDCGEDW